MKKTLISLSLFIILVALSGCAKKDKEIGGDNSLVNREATCSVMTDSNERDVCFWNIVNDTLDIIFCERIISDETKDFCYIGMAAVKEDGLICEENIVDIGRIDLCYIGIAEKKEDIEYCAEKITNEISLDICYAQVAKITLDLQICREKIKSESSKDSCFLLIERRTGLKDLCEEIQDEEVRSLCEEHEVEQ